MAFTQETQYEGIAAKGENLIFEVRNQILAYASIYEAVIENVLTTYYADSKEYEALIHHTVPIPIDIPLHKKEKLKKHWNMMGTKLLHSFINERRKINLKYDLMTNVSLRKK